MQKKTVLKQDDNFFWSCNGFKWIQSKIMIAKPPNCSNPLLTSQKNRGIKFFSTSELFLKITFLEEAKLRISRFISKKKAKKAKMKNMKIYTLNIFTQGCK